MLVMTGNGKDAREFRAVDVDALARTTKSLCKRAREVLYKDAVATQRGMERAEGAVAWIQRPEDFDALEPGDIGRARDSLVAVRARLEGMVQFFRGFYGVFADADDRETAFAEMMVAETLRRAMWLDSVLADYQRGITDAAAPFLRVTVDGVDRTPAVKVEDEAVPKFDAMVDGLLGSKPYGFGRFRDHAHERLYFAHAAAWYFVQVPAGSALDNPEVVLGRAAE